MSDSVSHTALGPIEWTDWRDHPHMLVKYRDGIFSQLAPRYYKTSVELDYRTLMMTEPDRVRDVLSCHRSIAVMSLVDRVSTDWEAEVPSEPVDFASGAGISSGASMFFNRPLPEIQPFDEDEE